MIGKTILGYTVQEKIGSGGFGTVYKVSKTNASGTYVRALKHITIPDQRQYADVLNSMGGDFIKANKYFSSVLNEIVNEIKIISKLSESGTKNIVRYYENDIVETDNPKRYDIYILMECLVPFTNYLYENEFTVQDVINLGKNILEALVSCHAQNVIHRDIKEDNLFIGPDGTYKLGDFGVSKILRDSSRAESMKGTPTYIAPEVYLGKEKYDSSVDLYSLGIVLYKLLNKSRGPFLPTYPASYSTDDEYEAFDKRMKGDTPDLPYDAKNRLGEVVVKAVMPRASRYNTAQEFLKNLEEAEALLSSEEKQVVVNQVIQQPKKSEKEVSLDDEATVCIDPKVFINVNNMDDVRREAVEEHQGNKVDYKVDNTEENKKIGAAVVVIPIVLALVFILLRFLTNPEGYIQAITIVRVLKALSYIVAGGFIASLYVLGKRLQNKKPEYNVQAVAKNQDAYLKAMELYEAIKNCPSNEAKDAKTAVRNVMESLRSESDFGYGSNAVIACETDIVRLLQVIEGNIQALFDERTAVTAGKVITDSCSTLQSKLKIRKELKKK